MAEHEKETIKSVIDTFADCFSSKLLSSYGASYAESKYLERIIKDFYRKEGKDGGKSFLEWIDKSYSPKWYVVYSDIYRKDSGGWSVPRPALESYKKSLDHAIEWTPWYFQYRIDYLDEDIPYEALLEKYYCLRKIHLDHKTLIKDRKFEKEESLRRKKELAYAREIF